MTKHEELIKEAFSDIYPRTSDEEFAQVIRERSVNMINETNGKKALKRTVIIVAAAAVMSAAVITAGAATDWDIASLFTSRNTQARMYIAADTKLEDIRRYYSDEAGVDVPDNVRNINGTTAEREYDILRNISHTIDRTVEFDDYIVYIDGFAYDGSRLDLLYDVTYKGGYDMDKFGGFDGHPFTFELYNGEELLSGGSGSSSIGAFADTTHFRMSLYIKANDVPDSAALKMKRIPHLEELAEFELELSVPDDMRLSLDTNAETTGEDGSYVNIKNVTVTPFSIIVNYLTDAQEEPGTAVSTGSAETVGVGVPVYITYKDGTVFDTSGYGNSAFRSFDRQPNGLADVTAVINARGGVIDVQNIASVQVFNAVINS